MLLKMNTLSGICCMCYASFNKNYGRIRPTYMRQMLVPYSCTSKQNEFFSSGPSIIRLHMLEGESVTPQICELFAYL